MQTKPVAAPGTKSPSPGVPTLTGLSGSLAVSLATGLLPLTHPAPPPPPPTAAASWAGTAAAAAAYAHTLEVGADYMPPPPQAAAAAPAQGADAAAADVPLPDMPPPSAAASPAPPALAEAAGWARKVLSLLMVMLNNGDVDVQCGAVQVLLELLMRGCVGGGGGGQRVSGYDTPTGGGGSGGGGGASGNEDMSKIVEQVSMHAVFSPSLLELYMLSC